MADQDETAVEQLTERLTAYVTPGARAVAVDRDYIASCVTEALALVGQVCGTHTVDEAIRERAVIETGSELFHRRQAPNGISQFAAPDGSAMRVARDPMNVARTILAPFVPLGFA